MEAGALAAGAGAHSERAIDRSRATGVRRSTAIAIPAVIVLVMVAAKGLHDVAQRGLNGLSLGSIYALGAVGLTLVYGILKLVNFAHGDFLTFGAYMAYLVNVTWGLPLVVAIFWAMLMTAVLGVVLEKVMWGPMRARGAGMLQLLLMSIGLALRDPLQDPVHLEHRAAATRRRSHRHGRVPRPADRPHGADRDHHRLRDA